MSANTKYFLCNFPIVLCRAHYHSYEAKEVLDNREEKTAEECEKCRAERFAKNARNNVLSF